MGNQSGRNRPPLDRYDLAGFGVTIDVRMHHQFLRAELDIQRQPDEEGGRKPASDRGTSEPVQPRQGIGHRWSRARGL